VVRIPPVVGCCVLVVFPAVVLLLPVFLVKWAWRRLFAASRRSARQHFVVEGVRQPRSYRRDRGMGRRRRL
jgi:hypothetical protein